jgi:hypothetical protein
MKHPHAVLVQPSKHPPPASIHVEARSTWTSRATNKLKPPSARSTWRSNHIWIDNAQSKLVGAKPCKFGAKQKIIFWVFVACLDNSSLGLSSTASSQITEACIYILYIYIHTYIIPSSIFRCCQETSKDTIGWPESHRMIPFVWKNGDDLNQHGEKKHILGSLSKEIEHTNIMGSTYGIEYDWIKRHTLIFFGDEVYKIVQSTIRLILFSWKPHKDKASIGSAHQAWFWDCIKIQSGYPSHGKSLINGGFNGKIIYKWENNHVMNQALQSIIL